VRLFGEGQNLAGAYRALPLLRLSCHDGNEENGPQ
jgi:hypothetical protein